MMCVCLARDLLLSVRVSFCAVTTVILAPLLPFIFSPMHHKQPTYSHANTTNNGQVY